MLKKINPFVISLVIFLVLALFLNDILALPFTWVLDVKGLPVVSTFSDVLAHFQLPKELGGQGFSEMQAKGAIYGISFLVIFLLTWVVFRVIK